VRLHLALRTALIRLPINFHSKGSIPSPASYSQTVDADGGRTVRVMLVEDEPFIALDLETIIAAMGHDVVGVADCLNGALVLAEASKADAAFIDVNLRDGFTGLDVACALRDRFGIRFGFVTGNPEQLPVDACRNPQIGPSLEARVFHRRLPTIQRPARNLRRRLQDPDQSIRVETQFGDPAERARGEAFQDGGAKAQ